jgi:hypothetical protein
MEIAKNLTVICQWQDGSYNCTVDIWDESSQSWDLDCSYCAREGDPAPVNVWIMDQINTGAYSPVSACPIPPSIDASFSPSSVKVGSMAVLSWTAINADKVTMQDDPGVDYPPSGSRTFTLTAYGKLTITLTATGPTGVAYAPASVNVTA